MSKRSEIDAELLMAYADGELSPIEAKRVERAIAADPALQAQVDAHRKLRAMLANGFAPVAEQPVPDRLATMLRTGQVVDLAEARAARRPIAPTPVWTRWVVGSMMAACLVMGLMMGQIVNRGPVESRGGVLVASGGLRNALDTQLAAANAPGAPLRLLVSFKDGDGNYCRSFASATLSGIACRDNRGWVLRETRAGGGVAGTDYRQAGSTDAALMADAQALMAGEPLDAAAEASARAKGWR